MKALHKKRLLKLADFLEKLPRKKFDFCYIVKGEDTPRKALDCGSVACAIGWCPVVFPRLLKYAPASPISINDYEVCVREDDSAFSSLNAMEKVFGLSKSDTHGLFMPDEQWRIDAPRLTYSATPKQVSRNIRKFIAKHL